MPTALKSSIWKPEVEFQYGNHLLIALYEIPKPCMFRNIETKHKLLFRVYFTPKFGKTHHLDLKCYNNTT